MDLKKYFLIVIIQLLAVPVAVLSFKFIEVKFIAASVAGAYFLLSSSMVLAICFKYRKPLMRSPIFWSSLGFFLFFAIPIFLGRMVYPPDVPFSEIAILGIPGPTLHRLANSYYTVMTIMTFLELAIFLRASKKQA